MKEKLKDLLRTAKEKLEGMLRKAKKAVDVRLIVYVIIYCIVLSELTLHYIILREIMFALFESSRYQLIISLMYTVNMLGFWWLFKFGLAKWFQYVKKKKDDESIETDEAVEGIEVEIGENAEVIEVADFVEVETDENIL